MNAPNFMALHGNTLIANGYAIIPIQPGTKAPGKFTRNEWSNYSAWSRHCDRATTDFEVDVWKTWPSCGIGLAGGAVCGVDIDIPDTEAAYEVERLARLYLGDTPCLRVGNHPKRLLVYRTSAPFASRKVKPLEILCHGTQFVIHAIHPDTGKEYEWPYETLTETDISALPEIGESDVDTFYAEAWKIIPDNFKSRGVNPSAAPPRYVGQAGASLSGKLGTVPAIKAALDFVPNVDLDRADWIGVGMSIKGAVGEAGFPLWIEWSRSSSKSGASGKGDTPERTWRSLRPHSRGAGSLYYRAMQAGWVPDTSLTLNGDAELPQIDLTAFRKGMKARLAREGKEVAQEAARLVDSSLSLLEVEGALGLMVREIIATTPKRRQPMLALGAALAAVGALAGRRYRSATNLRTNLYIVGVGESGSGKDHAPAFIRDLMHDAGLMHYMGGEKIGSGAGFVTSLSRHPSRLFVMDEFGLFLQSTQGFNAPGPVKAIREELMKFFSRAGSIYLGTEYADQKEKARVDIQQPNACLYGMTTPSTFWAGLEGRAMVDGFIARLLVIVSDNHRPPPVEIPAVARASPELVQLCQRIAGGGQAAGMRVGDHQYTNANMMTAGEALIARTVPMDAKAAELHKEWTRTEDSFAQTHEGTDKSSIVNRWAEHATKLAMVRAISASPENPVISAQFIDWGWRLSQMCITNVIRDAERYVSSNETEANVKAILHAVKEAGAITLTELAAKTRGIKTRERNEVLTDFVAQGIMTEAVAPHKGRGRPTKVYTHIDAMG